MSVVTPDDEKAAREIVRGDGPISLSADCVAFLRKLIAQDRASQREAGVQAERQRIRDAVRNLPWRIVHGEGNDSWRAVPLDDVLGAIDGGKTNEVSEL